MWGEGRLNPRWLGRVTTPLLLGRLLIICVTAVAAELHDTWVYLNIPSCRSVSCTNNSTAGSRFRDALDIV